MDYLHEELVRLGYFRRLKPLNYNEELGVWMTTKEDKWICKNINKLNKIELHEDFNIKICTSGYKECLNDILSTSRNKNIWNSNFKEKRFINRKSLFGDKIFIPVKKYTTMISNKEIEKYLIKSIHKRYENYYDLYKETYFRNLSEKEVIKSIKKFLLIELKEKQIFGLLTIYYYFYSFDSFILIHLIDLFNKNKEKYSSLFKKLLNRIKDTPTEEILANLSQTASYNKGYFDLMKYIYKLKNDNSLLKLLQSDFFFDLSMELVSIENHSEISKIVLDSEMTIVLKQKFFRKIGKLIHSPNNRNIKHHEVIKSFNNEDITEVVYKSNKCKNLSNKKNYERNQQTTQINILNNKSKETKENEEEILNNEEKKVITHDENEKILRLLFNKNPFIHAYNISYYKKIEAVYFQNLQFESDNEKSYCLNAIINQQIFHNNKIELKRINYKLLTIEDRRKYLKLMYLRSNYTFITENVLDFEVCLKKDLNFLKQFTNKITLIEFCKNNRGVRIFDILLLYQRLPDDLLKEMFEVYIERDTSMFYRILKQMKQIENADTLIMKIFSKPNLKIEIFNVLLDQTSLKERHYIQILYISLFSYKSNNKKVFIKMFKKLCKKINAQQIYATILNFLFKGIKKSILYISFSILIIKHPHILPIILVDSFIKEDILISVLKATKYFPNEKKYKKIVKTLCRKLTPIIQHGILHTNKQIINIAIESICHTIKYYQFATQQTFFNIFLEKFYNQKDFIKKYIKISKNLNEEILKPTLLDALQGNKKKRIKGLILFEIFRKNFRKNKTFAEVFNEIFLFN